MTMAIFFLLLIILLTTPADYALYFKAPPFNTTSIIFEGDAAPSTLGVEFIDYRYTCRVGRASLTERVHLWDSRTGNLSDFSSHFSFTIDTLKLPYNVSGAGFAFFLAPFGFQIPLNSDSGFLGLFNKTMGDQIVVVEFDTFVNLDWDPPFQHVGINNNSIRSAVTTPWNGTFHSGDTVDVRIAYSATTKNFSVLWDHQTTSNPLEKNFLSYIIDLSKVLPEWIMVGFSAATGAYPESNFLRSWEFSSSLDISDHTDRKETGTKRLLVGSLVSVSTLFVGILIISRILWRKKQLAKQIAEKAKLLSMNNDLEKGTGPRRYSHKDLIAATKNFSNERKLGEGGFGSVYKGYIVDQDLLVAVKKFSKGSSQGKKEYTTEVKIISQLRHRNLVQLLGWCHEEGELLLVYEFMPNGSLDSHLFGKKTSLTWALRHKIALGLASALLYLHEEWEQCVVHRDIKSSNIMLDANFNLKLGDFGLARLLDHELPPKTTGLAGTFGYMAPEYIGTGRASKESDVYSFGVVALEIATGKKAVDPAEKKSLVQWVWDLYGGGEVDKAVDERLEHDMISIDDKRQMECLIIVGLWCAHPDCRLRPSIRQAIQVLHFEANLPSLDSKMPVLTFHVPDPNYASSSLSSSAT